MLPLSFSEFTDFCGVEFASGRPVGIALGGEPILFDEMLTRYLEYGGMPAIASLKTTQAQHSAYMSGAYEAGRVLYVQATDEMFASETREREIAPLKSIRDNHEKIVVVRQGSYDTDIDGIRIVSARDFFL